MKKRVIALFLAVMMLASMMAVTVYAEGTPTFRVSDAGEAARGAQVSVTVSMENNPGIMGFSLSVSYDETRLSLTSLTCADELTGNKQVNGARVTWVGNSDVSYNGVFLTANFTVLDDAPLGDAAVSISYQPGDIGNFNEEEINFEVVAGGVTVICDHAWDEGVVTTEPTCTQDGVKTYTCTLCGETRTEPVPATGHTSDEGVVTTEPTCTEDGIKTYKCTVCGEVLKTEAISAPGHTSDEGVVTTEPTCTEDGVKTYTCTVCGQVLKTEPVPATGHTWGEWVLTTEPTLDADGEETRTCQTCGATETRHVAAVVYTVSFNANGGSGAPESQRKLQGAALTLSETVPTRDGFIFKGWAESAGAAEAQYQPGGSFTADADTTLYAVWEKDASYVGAITVGTITRARPGTEVTVPISLTENPGITGIGMKIEYDKTRLRLTGYSDAGLTGWVVGVGTGEKAVWGDAVGSTITGDILTLTFTVLEGAEDGLAEITVTELDITDLDVNNVEFSVTSGGVTVANSIPGDVNGDGRVAIADVVTLKRYLAGMDVEIDPVAADVNGDGKQTIADVVLIMRYLAGMDVVLK